MDITLIGFLVAGLALLLLGGSFLVRGASQLAQTVGMSPLIVGLTVVALGTSAPELAASVAAALQGQGDIAFGNVVGSNILNILFILGASAIIAPLVVMQKLVRVDVPIMIGLSLAVLVFGWDGRIARTEGLLLVAGAVGYIILTIRSSRKESSEVKAEYAQEFASSPSPSRTVVLASLLFVLGGLALLVWGSRWVVDGAVGVARALGTSELIIGLTIVAAGTSLPEVTTSILAALKGERDIAVGNVIGSNIFNILTVLGISSLVAPGGIPTTPAAMSFDVPVMIVAALACLPIFFTGHRIDRWEGFVLLGYYVAYILFLILDTSGHDQLPLYSTIVLAFIAPLTILTFAIVIVRQLRQ